MPWVYVYPLLRNSERCKAKLVANGFVQKESIDYNEVFAPLYEQSQALKKAQLMHVEATCTRVHSRNMWPVHAPAWHS